ncbi:MAG TPA: HAD family phosphatase [Sphingomonadaceae bacterium]|nr:HAD family phosphatase [Sphingomonadaceae bacterium]
MSETIKAVVFDVGNVLFHWDLRFLMEKVIDDPARLEHFLGEVLTFEFHSRHDAGEGLEVLVAELLDRHPDYADAIHAYVHRFNETIGGPVAGMHELVQQLAEAGVPLFALTNFGTTFWNGFLPTAPIFGHFHDILVSGEECLAKPDPAIYQLAEERFGHAPHELFFTDDRAENVEAARQRGWQVHRFTSAGALADELRELGLIA